MNTKKSGSLIRNSLTYGFHETFKHPMAWFKVWLKCFGYLLLFTIANFIIAAIILTLLALFVSTLRADCMAGAVGGLAQVFLIIAAAFISAIAAIPLLFYYFPRLILGMTHTYLNFFDNGNITFTPNNNTRMIMSYVGSKCITYLVLTLFTLFFGGIIGITSFSAASSLFSSPPGILKLILYILSIIVLHYFFMFSTYFIVDQNFSAQAAVKASGKLSWDNLGTLPALSIITSLIFLIPFIGLPITQAMSVYLYRTLTKVDLS